MVFESAKLDVVILEVGMGGRTDATNAISDDCILVSSLTAVDLDHQKFLGDTVGEIAGQKAGIARKGRPFVVGPQKYPDVMDSVKAVVETAGADLMRPPCPVANVGRGRGWSHPFFRSTPIGDSEELNVAFIGHFPTCLPRPLRGHSRPSCLSNGQGT